MFWAFYSTSSGKDSDCSFTVQNRASIESSSSSDVSRSDVQSFQISLNHLCKLGLFEKKKVYVWLFIYLYNLNTVSKMHTFKHE